MTRCSMVVIVVIMALGLPVANAQTITVYAGSGSQTYNGEHIAAVAAGIGKAAAGVMDEQGNLFYADAVNNRIRKIDAGGKVVTIAGNGIAGYAPDGVQATDAAINQPSAIAIDAEGNIYFAEYLNAVVRKIDRQGILTTVAGSAVSGYYGNTRPATEAKLQGPSGLAVDKAGNLYIADADNNCVRKVDKATGIITLYAGNAKGHGTGQGGYSGDGGKAIAAHLNQPGSLTFDEAGNLYISDCFNHCIRKVSPAGTISTVAGTGQPGFNGDGNVATTAQLSFPDGLAVDKEGNLYISDNGNSRLRVVNKAGIISTAAGNGEVTRNFGKPGFVVVNNDGDLLVGDNYRIRLLKDTRGGVAHNSGANTNSHVSSSAISVSGGGL